LCILILEEAVNELALFAGAGGGILGGTLLGWRTVCAVEFDPYARDVLVARQNDGCLPPFPIWDDVRTFDGRPWHGVVDVVSGGFPCQDISAAGKGAGIGGARSGLWREMARIVGEVRPRFVWVENSPMLVGRGLGLVLLDLAAMGFSARWGVVGACDAGAPHQRHRIWILAHAECTERRPTGAEGCHNQGGQDPDGLHAGRQEMSGGAGASREVVADADGGNRLGRCGALQVGRESGKGEIANNGDGNRIEWIPEPDVGRVAHGVAARVDRLCCLGNGQVPGVAAMAWRILSMHNNALTNLCKKEEHGKA
jgi:DNA (cytosine-5)-methyltransferase 1